MSRRLIIAFHNGWRTVNKKGMNNFAKLDDVQTDDEIKQLLFEGEIELDNVLI